jgi:hypothetical protein
VTSYKSPGSGQILAKLVQAGGETLESEILKLVHYILNKEELPDQWIESVSIPVYKKGDITDCSKYRGISLLLTSYKILSNICLSRISPCIDTIIGVHQCGFRQNRSTTDHIFCICPILEKIWSTMRQYISYS